MELTQVRFSKDCTFNTTNGRELIRQASAKNSLRLSAGAFELNSIALSKVSTSRPLSKRES